MCAERGKGGREGWGGWVGGWVVGKERRGGWVVEGGREEWKG